MSMDTYDVARWIVGATDGTSDAIVAEKLRRHIDAADRAADDLAVENRELMARLMAANAKLARQTEDLRARRLAHARDLLDIANRTCAA